MKPDEFEQQLRKQPLRAVPSDWRAELLIVARSARVVHGPVEPIVPWWRVWFWPCPQAWAGLAAVWLLLLGLHLGAPSASTMASQSIDVNKQAGLAAQRRELARLLDVPSDPAPPQSPSPRSMAEPRPTRRADMSSRVIQLAARENVHRAQGCIPTLPPSHLGFRSAGLRPGPSLSEFQDLPGRRPALRGQSQDAPRAPIAEAGSLFQS